MDEKCARCGDVGEDRRTLFHACFYEMAELGVPFETHILFHADPEALVKAQDPVSLSPLTGHSVNIAAGTVKTNGELTPHKMYTLRVCKNCRADWLASVKGWFNSVPEAHKGCGSGIFMRCNGTTVEVTPDQYRQIKAGRFDAEQP
jgi:hypothetical protein